MTDQSGGTPRILLPANNPGTDAKFQLNGIPIDQASNTVNNVISGLTFNIVGKSTTPTTLTLASDPSQLTNDLQTFVTNYNALATAVQAQTGSSGGALVGDSTMATAANHAARYLAIFRAAAEACESLSDLGVTFNGIDGTLTFDPTKVSGMGSSQLTDALSYLGSTTTGLGAFSQNFDQFGNSVTGLIQTEISSDTASDANLQKHIDSTTAQINLMQQNLAKQIEASDALESAYESQQTELTASLQGLDLVLYGKAVGSP